MPGFVADIWGVTAHLSTEKTWEIHLYLQAGTTASLKRAD